MKTTVFRAGVRALLFLFLITFHALLITCSSEDPIVDDNNGGSQQGEEPLPPPPSPYSAGISSGSTGLPGGSGVITSEFSDFVNGNDVSRMADQNPKSMMELPHTSFYVI